MKSDKPGVIIVGTGGHSLAVADAIREEGIFRIEGLVARTSACQSPDVNLRIAGLDKDLPNFVSVGLSAICGVGQIRSPDIRIRIFNSLVALGAQIPTIVSPHAHVSRDAHLGVGVVVLHRAVIGPGAVIGDNCIVNTGAIVEHQAKISSHCHLSTGSVVNGNVRVGEGAFVGSGSVVLENAIVGARAVVGAGCVVDRDVESGVVLRRRVNQCQ